MIEPIKYRDGFALSKLLLNKLLNRKTDVTITKTVQVLVPGVQAEVEGKPVYFPPRSVPMEVQIVLTRKKKGQKSMRRTE